jgi:hypothetical protein
MCVCVFYISIQNGLKQGDALPSWILTFSLHYVTVMVRKLNGAHQLLVHTDDVNLVGDNINAIKKITEVQIDVSKEVGL